MTGEEQTVPLIDYVNMRFDESDKRVADALAANEKRLDGMNEFRQTLNDQARELLPRKEYDSNHTSLIDKMEAGDKALAARVSALEVKAGEGVGEKQGSKDRSATIIGGIVVGGLILNMLVVLLANGVFAR